MAWENRDYNQTGRGFGGGFGGTLGGGHGGGSVVMWLLGINVLIHLVDSVLRGGSRTAESLTLFRWGNFNIAEGIFGLQLWRPITYQFLHADFFHILFNMLILFFFGPMIERWLGSRRFLAFYILCGICGAAAMSLLAVVPGLLGLEATTPLVGASGSIFGILVAAMVVAPNQTVQLFLLPFSFKMKTLVSIMLGLAILRVLAGTANAGGEAAHLGGALLGYFLIKSPDLLNFADRVSDSPIADLREKQQEFVSKRSAKVEAKMAAEVDRILKKVSDNGLHSLTEKERKTLKSETERQQKSG